jgi:hypothetical protein
MFYMDGICPSWLYHDENQKHKIAHEANQYRKGADQRRNTGLLRWQVHRIVASIPGWIVA